MGHKEWSDGGSDPSVWGFTPGRPCLLGLILDWGQWGPLLYTSRLFRRIIYFGQSLGRVWDLNKTLDFMALYYIYTEKYILLPLYFSLFTDWSLRQKNYKKYPNLISILSSKLVRIYLPYPAWIEKIRIASLWEFQSVELQENVRAESLLQQLSYEWTDNHLPMCLVLSW